MDGPDSVGKSTVAAEVSSELSSRRLPVHLPTEPTKTPLGQLIRREVDKYQGLALACLVTASRNVPPIPQGSSKRKGGTSCLSIPLAELHTRLREQSQIVLSAFIGRGGVSEGPVPTNMERCEPFSGTS